MGTWSLEKAASITWRCFSLPGPWWCSSAAWVPPATCRPRRRVWEQTSPSSEGTGQGFSSSGSSQAHRLRKQGSRKAAGSLRWVWERAHAGDLWCRWDARSVERAPVQSGFWPASRPPPSLSFPNPAPCLELRAAQAATQVFTQTYLCTQRCQDSPKGFLQPWEEKKQKGVTRIKTAIWLCVPGAACHLVVLQSSSLLASRACLLQSNQFRSEISQASVTLSRE